MSAADETSHWTNLAASVASGSSSADAWVKLLARNLTSNVAGGMDFGRHLERPVLAELGRKTKHSLCDGFGRGTVLPFMTPCLTI